MSLINDIMSVAMDMKVEFTKIGKRELTAHYTFTQSNLKTVGNNDHTSDEIKLYALLMELFGIVSDNSKIRLYVIDNTPHIFIDKETIFTKNFEMDSTIDVKLLFEDVSIMTKHTFVGCRFLVDNQFDYKCHIGVLSFVGGNDCEVHGCRVNHLESITDDDTWQSPNVVNECHLHKLSLSDQNAIPIVFDNTEIDIWDCSTVTRLSVPRITNCSISFGGIHDLQLKVTHNNRYQFLEGCRLSLFVVESAHDKMFFRDGSYVKFYRRTVDIHRLNFKMCDLVGNGTVEFEFDPYQGKQGKIILAKNNFSGCEIHLPNATGLIHLLQCSKVQKQNTVNAEKLKVSIERQALPLKSIKCLEAYVDKGRQKSELFRCYVKTEVVLKELDVIEDILTDIESITGITRLLTANLRGVELNDFHKQIGKEVCWKI